MSMVHKKTMRNAHKWHVKHRVHLLLVISQVKQSIFQLPTPFKKLLDFRYAGAIVAFGRG